MAVSSRSLSDRSMFLKLMTSLQAPLTVLPCAGWTDEDVWFPKASKSIRSHDRVWDELHRIFVEDACQPLTFPGHFELERRRGPKT